MYGVRESFQVVAAVFPDVLFFFGDVGSSRKDKKRAVRSPVPHFPAVLSGDNRDERLDFRVYCSPPLFGRTQLGRKFPMLMA